MQPIDLRSDTVTQPLPEMREAMYRAAVGDDVFEEDPTINCLQELAAAQMGKEAGLFVPSGTMGNLIAALVHCQRGEEAIIGDLSHTFLFEVGGISALGGIFPHTLPNQPDGTLKLEDIRGAIRSENIHFPKSRLLILENTHNRCGGTPLSREYTRQAGELAHASGLAFHIDGARIFNAAAAEGVSAADLAAPADSITFCLSKALCAPVGSVLCGNRDFIASARRIRKQLGGGMRQAGILAAAGIVALELMPPRLVDDHRRAARLAEGLAGLPGVFLPKGMPRSNMVFPELKPEVTQSARAIESALAAQGILIGRVSERGFRLVTHAWISDADVEMVIAGFAEVLARA